MSKKLIVLALAVVSAVMFALPAAAMAGEWEISEPEAFTAAGGEAKLTVRPNAEGEEVSEIQCSANTASGEYETTSTGKNLTITFTGCGVFGVGGSECHSSGQANGTIKTTDLKFHNVMLEATEAPGYPNGTPGILITSNENHFASFTCSLFGFPIASVSVNGNGIIGDISNECGTRSNTAGLSFTSSSTGEQTWKQVTTSGETFDLTSTSGGVTRTASEDANGTITFANEQAVNCP